MGICRHRLSGLSEMSDEAFLDLRNRFRLTLLSHYPLFQHLCSIEYSHPSAHKPSLELQGSQLRQLILPPPVFETIPGQSLKSFSPQRLSMIKLCLLLHITPHDSICAIIIKCFKNLFHYTSFKYNPSHLISRLQHVCFLSQSSPCPEHITFYLQKTFRRDLVVFGLQFGTVSCLCF